MKKNDEVLLMEAYLSMSKPKIDVPSDKETLTTDPNEEVSVGSMQEPAPGVEVQMVEPEAEPSVPAAVELGVEDNRLSDQDEDEEDSMSLDNLNSIRESIMKIARFCSAGEHLEPWMQQQLAIAMDNLAGIARALR